MTVLKIIQDQPKTSMFWIALLRIMLGLLFITQWYDNLVNGIYTPAGLEGSLNYFFSTSDNPLDFYMVFVNQVILPIAPFFTKFQLVTELLIGIALLVGFLTPLTSLFAAFFILNTFLVSWGADWPWSYLTILTILGVLFFTRAGRSLGLDAILARRFGDVKFAVW
ncbi:MAG: DoxX family protein [Anaerolineales bacterium]|jgi:uncharacterized membrane protein YphA (DoxX/SURF4 family)